MRVFWWQGGLHIHPESDVETEAILVLLDALKPGKPPEFCGPPAQDVHHDKLGQVERGLDLDL